MAARTRENGSRGAPHRVAVLALPSVVPFDLAVAVQVFGYPRPDLGARRYTTVVCGHRRGRVTTSGGFAIVVERGLDALGRAGTIVVPGTDDLDLPLPRGVAEALRAAHDRGARILSICTGAFVLAEAGLLAGRRAATHWLDAPLLASRYPELQVDAGVLYVDDGSVLTSAGMSAGIDLCLHVVRSDHGAAVANAIARRMVIPPLRAGGQAQFVANPIPDPAGRQLEHTRAWVQRRLAEPVTVGEMARHASMSLRTFARRFRDETGTTPLRWLLRSRILAAQQLLEETDLGVEMIASRCGFGSAISLRAHFRRELGNSPIAYRRAFRARAEPSRRDAPS